MKLTRESLYLAFCAFVLFAVTACASLGIPTPDTFNKRFAVALNAVSEVRTQATNLLAAKKIGIADAENMQAQADNARAGLTVARQIAATDLPAGNNRLTAAITVLTALQGYLAAQEAAAPK